MDEGMYQEFLRAARLACRSYPHLDAEDMLHNVILNLLESGRLGEVRTPGLIYTAVKHRAINEYIRYHKYGRGRVELHPDIEADQLDVDLQVIRNWAVGWVMEQAPLFPGIAAHVGEALGYSTEEVARALGMEHRLLTRLMRSFAVVEERVVDTCISCRRVADLEGTFRLCEACRVPHEMTQAYRPPPPVKLAPTPVVRLPRARVPRVRPPKVKPPRRWARHHDQCTQCGRSDSKHASKGVCNRCYTAAKYNDGSRMGGRRPRGTRAV